MRILKIFLTIIILTVCLCSCQNGASPDKVSGIQKKLFEMKSFKAVVQINIITNKNTTSYDANQFFLYPGKYRLEMTSPDTVKGLVTIDDNKRVWFSNPAADFNNTYLWQKVMNNNPNLTFLTNFFSSYIKSEKSQMKIKNQEYVFNTVISDGSPYFDSASLTLKADGVPRMLEIFDSKGNVRVSVLYKEFLINPKLNNSMFEIPQN